MKDIGQIDVGLFCLRIHVAHPSEGDGDAVGLGALDADDVVRGDPSSFLGLVPLNNPVFDIAFQPSDKPDLLKVKLIEPAEIDVGLIDDQDAVRFKPHPSGCNDVRCFAVGNYGTRGNVSPMIQNCMNLHCSLSLSKPSPSKKAEAKTDDGGVKGIERILE